MKQEYLFQPVPSHRLEQLTKEELIEFIEAQDRLIASQKRLILQQQALNAELKQRSLFVDEQLITIKNKLFGKSSEREPKANDADKAHASAQKLKKIKVQLPSLRYPNAPLIERHVELQEMPSCDCCGEVMKDTGMTEESEFLTVIPEQFLVVRQIRHKYGCGKCHGCLKTAPAPKRITPGSVLSDEMAVDVALSKYCDLIPIERYAAMADRAGLKDLPAQSLIESTHNLADFVSEAYVGIKKQILEAKVLHADETPHRMLEGDKKSGWYHWGFSTPKACYFEIRDTRSGDVASDLLKKSKCEYLMSDVFSGYAKTVRATNEFRQEITEEENKPPPIRNIYCNAHARRKFKTAKDSGFEEAEYFIKQYQEIYRLEDLCRQAGSVEQRTELRQQMLKSFIGMKEYAMLQIGACSEKSNMGKAVKYFLKNFEEFTLFTKAPDLPIDNNSQERLLRSPVIGRKTWYGTHSKRGALTAAILFSLVESCKLIRVNPREYFKQLVEDLHAGKPAYTPLEYSTR